MDNVSLWELIRKIPELKFKYLGSFSPEQAIPIQAMPKDKFQIVNTTNDSSGDHWVAIIKDQNGNVIFGDSLGKKVENYPELKKIFHKQISKTLITKGPIQSTPDMCGFYAVYFAFMTLQSLHTANMSEHDLFRFVNKYYSY